MPKPTPEAFRVYVNDPAVPFPDWLAAQGATRLVDGSYTVNGTTVQPGDWLVLDPAAQTMTRRTFEEVREIVTGLAGKIGGGTIVESEKGCPHNQLHMIHVPGRGMPTTTHRDWRKVEAEADRIARLHPGQPVHILSTARILTARTEA